jgi:hypothetical protein
MDNLSRIPYECRAAARDDRFTVTSIMVTAE